ncbi:hypothetical protein FGIG_03403 [Fasciola gigantica]|uniref:Tubulin epsilon and delta complex protein 1 domain-containing protein n=1 Tax=Fasciola gigantica TaxID=46835 RepID=A0A504YA71_FASGI|nr:hypothetical protein FGIG_03403 [Fasciola gigantica]
MASALVKIKTCVELLTKLLKCVGFSHLSAEDFRLAKFNDSKASDSMLRLLFEIIYFAEYHCIDGICFAAYEKFSRKSILNFVHNELIRSGYPRSVNELLTGSSRELLIAALWLFRCRSLLFEIAKSIYGDLSSVFDPLLFLVAEKAKNAHNNTTEAPDNIGRANSSVGNLCWYVGRLLVQFKELHQTRMAVVNRRSRCSHPFGISPDWKQTETHLRERIQTIRTITQKLDLLFSWASNDSTFWRWAISVLEANGEQLNSVEPLINISDDLDNAARALDFSMHRLRLIAQKFGISLNPWEYENLEVNPDCIPTVIMDEINMLCEQLQGKFTPNVYSFTPIQFRYVMEGVQTLEKTQTMLLEERLQTAFNLKTECCRLNLLIETAKRKCDQIRLELAKELQDWATECLPDTLFIYNPATRLPDAADPDHL